MTFHLISGALMFLGALYLCLRCVLPLRVSGWSKLALCAVVFACAFKLQISRLLFPGVVLPEVDSLWLVVSGWAFAVIILWVLLCLLWDAGFVLWRVFRRLFSGRGGRSAARSPSRSIPGRGLRVACLLGGALLLATVSTVQGVSVPPVKRVDVFVENLPPALHNFRMVQLSDMHVSALFRESWTREVVTRANALRPDLVVLTGDVIDGSTRARAADVAPLADLHARYGVYACLGNHEYYAGMEPWVLKLESLGIRVLLNSHALLTVQGQDNAAARMVLAGVADPSGASRMGKEMPNVPKAFAGSPQSSAGPSSGPSSGPSADPSSVPGLGVHAPVLRLLLAHQPRLAAEAAQHGVALQLSGHTHGGQLFPASLMVGSFNEGYLAGQYKVGGMQMYVSRGVGLWGGFPIRLGAPAEITEITLRPAGAASAEPAR